MKKRIMEKWVKALRSKKYKQGKDFLRQNNEFCCLGVLCDLSKSNEWIKSQFDDTYYYLGANKILPEDVRLWAGLKTENGTMSNDLMCLTELNDNGKTFKQIANIIEKRYKDL